MRRGDVGFDPRLAALLRVVRQVAANTGSVDETAWRAARDAGWSDEQLTEMFAYVMATMFTNYFNHMVGTDLDLPGAPPLPVPESASPA